MKIQISIPMSRYNRPMQHISDADAKHEFDSLLDLVQQEPVAIRKQDRDVAVLLSQGEYDRIYGLNLEEFHRACRRLSDEAQARGLTEEKLAEILADED